MFVDLLFLILLSWLLLFQGTVLFYAEGKDDLQYPKANNSTSMPFEDCNFPIVRLRGVRDTYPPQKKSFLMLRHMAVHVSHKFQWFLRADDDLFVNFNTIHTFLQAIYSNNSEQLFYIGQVRMVPQHLNRIQY